MLRTWELPRGVGLVARSFWVLPLWFPAMLAAQPSGVVSGTVRDSTGIPVIAAEVVLDGTSRRVLTSELGEFRLAGVAAGEAALTVRRLGFRASTRHVTVSPGGEVRLDVRLAAIPTQLPTVAVTARRQSFDSRLEGMYSRVERGAGNYITRDRLDQVHTYRFVDVLRELPGVRVVRDRAGMSVRMRGANCAPLVFIDGFPAAAGSLDLDMIDLFTVEAIEVYNGLASVPAEFASVRGLERCGVIAVWSRPYRPRPPAPRARAPLDIEQLVADRAVFTAEDVDTPAALLDGGQGPAYPDSLWRTRTGGRVVVEFIVDAAGRIQTGSFRVVSASHPLFAASVQRSLEGARFEAAVWQGRNVRQVVHLPFSFEPPNGTGGGSE